MAAPRLVADINPGSASSEPRFSKAIGDTLFFSANDGSSGGELWKSDGTAAGTVRVADINPGNGSSNPHFFTALNDTLFFRANDGSSGQELWKSDGTAAGTVRLADINPGSASSYPENFTAIGDTLFFSPNDGSSGYELWKSDGTAAGTVRVTDINPGSGGTGLRSLTAVGDTLFFMANDGSSGGELWKSDGTAAGTVRVADINPGSGSSNLGSLIAVGDTLFFSANDGSSGQELWKSDGTAAGTVRVADINLGSGSSFPTYITAIGNTLLFSAYDGSNGNELWKSDGTATGTVRVADINPGRASSNPSFITAIGNTLYFNANDGSSGNELWKSDGTDAGTIRVADINLYGASSNPYFITALNDTLFFRANDGSSGGELWKSDGTAAGTVRVADINPGRASSYPSFITATGDTLFFSADDGSSGSELWALALPTHPPFVNDGAASFTISGTPAVGQTLTAAKTADDPDGNGSFSHTWQASANGFTWAAIGAGSSLTIAKAQEGQQIRLLTSYTDDQGFSESLTATPVAIPFINDGKASFSISGTPAVGQTLTAAKTADDPDGNGTFSNTWQASTNGTTWSTIGTGSSLTIAKAQEGQQIRLLTAYTDGQGFSESLTATPVAIPFINDGKASFSISGSPAVGQSLTAAKTADDPDGNGSFSHTWQASANGSTWTAIATGSSLTVAKAQEGQQIRLLTAYTDGQGFSESLTATPVAIPSALIPTLAISPTIADQLEGNRGTTPFTFTVTRSGDTSDASSADWAVAGIGINQADARDFAGNRLPSGTVRFQPGVTSQTIIVNVRADLEQEPDESFSVSLSQATSATITIAAAVGAIRNDDLIGTAGVDTIRGSKRADFIDGRAGQDLLTGGRGPDLFGFRTRESPITAPDRITDFRFGEDQIAILKRNGTPRPLPRSFTRAANNRTATTLSELAAVVFADADGRRNGNQPLRANAAALVRASNRAIRGTYLLINDNIAGLNTSNDLLVNINGFRGSLPGLGTIARSLVFG